MGTSGVSVDRIARIARIRAGKGAAITIEIHTPELKALILQRMKSGGFQTVEEVILEALKTSARVAEAAGRTAEPRTGADLIAAL